MDHLEKQESALLQENWPAEFPKPEVIKAIVCCDVDETYIPRTRDKSRGGIAALEAYINTHAEDKGILLGWVTGTNLSSAWRKSTDYISRSPHFICCSLGTEFYWVKDGSLHSSEAWAERIRQSGYNQEKVREIVDTLLENGMPLEKQPEDYQGPYKASFYYPENPNMAEDFAFIEELAKDKNIRAVFTRCNPAAGDPADTYDVEFIPICCGKDQAVSFLIDETALTREAVIAFGDSANDFAMFAQAGQGYLVANADKYAIEQYGSCLEEAYCHGILSKLKALI
ncbi:HAD-IIB family hydrolase [Cardiobacteriaceae bacterium TAE3-ERU3]|nr:HAD-IIB family hydrolase [Cardiobacteriaceae bacterium TAE3-ERU3]